MNRRVKRPLIWISAILIMATGASVVLLLRPCYVRTADAIFFRAEGWNAVLLHPAVLDKAFGVPSAEHTIYHNTGVVLSKAGDLQGVFPAPTNRLSSLEPYVIQFPEGVGKIGVVLYSLERRESTTLWIDEEKHEVTVEGVTHPVDEIAEIEPGGNLTLLEGPSSGSGRAIEQAMRWRHVLTIVNGDGDTPEGRVGALERFRYPARRQMLEAISVGNDPAAELAAHILELPHSPGDGYELDQPILLHSSLDEVRSLLPPGAWVFDVTVSPYGDLLDFQVGGSPPDACLDNVRTAWLKRAMRFVPARSGGRNREAAGRVAVTAGTSCEPSQIDKMIEER